MINNYGDNKMAVLRFFKKFIAVFFHFPLLCVHRAYYTRIKKPDQIQLTIQFFEILFLHGVPKTTKGRTYKR